MWESARRPLHNAATIPWTSSPKPHFVQSVHEPGFVCQICAYGRLSGANNDDQAVLLRQATPGLGTYRSSRSTDSGNEKAANIQDRKETKQRQPEN